MGNIRILVVEDDKILLRFITRNLQVLKSSVPDVQPESTAIILLIQKFEENNFKTMIILVSNYSDTVVAVAGIQSSQFQYLKKPFSKKNLVNKLKLGLKTMMR